MRPRNDSEVSNRDRTQRELEDSYRFVWIVVCNLLSRARSGVETERRGQRAQLSLDDAAHGDEHVRGAGRLTQRRDGRDNAGEALWQQRDDRQQCGPHSAQAPNVRSPRAPIRSASAHRPGAPARPQR